MKLWPTSCSGLCPLKDFLRRLKVQLSSEARPGPAAPDWPAAARQERWKRPSVDSAD